MSGHVDQRLIERVRRLLAMAADTSSPHEAAIAASRAAKLMAKYNLDHAAVMLRDGIDDRITEEQAPREHHRVPRWYSLLIIPVAHLYDCETRMQENPVTGRWYSEFLGLDQDALVAAYVLDYLVNEIERLALRHRQSTGAGRRAMNDFRLGATHEIVLMLKRIEEEKRGGESAGAPPDDAQALMVVKRDLIREKYDVKYTRTSYSYRRSESYEQGREAGAGVAIRSGVGREPTRKLGVD
ncbi:MAG: DUF2786 domain-containing protein [Chromatocurvus sp.]